MASVEQLLDVGKRFVAGKATGWQASLVLEVGTELAVAVNKAAGLSGEQKSELIVQTVLHLLDDAEKAEKIALEESTVKEGATAPKELMNWEALRSLVKSVLPATLRLVVGAARGKFDLQSMASSAAAAKAASQASCLPPWLWGICGVAAEAAEVALVSAQEPIVNVQGPATLDAVVKDGSLRLAIPPQPSAEQPPKEQVTQAATVSTLQ